MGINRVSIDKVAPNNIANSVLLLCLLSLPFSEQLGQASFLLLFNFQTLTEKKREEKRGKGVEYCL